MLRALLLGPFSFFAPFDVTQFIYFNSGRYIFQRLDTPVDDDDRSSFKSFRSYELFGDDIGDSSGWETRNETMGDDDDDDGSSSAVSVRPTGEDDDDASSVTSNDSLTSSSTRSVSPRGQVCGRSHRVAGDAPSLAGSNDLVASDDEDHPDDARLLAKKQKYQVRLGVYFS